MTLTSSPAGHGWAQTLPPLDFETYSEAGYLWDAEAGRWRGLSPHSKGLEAVGVSVYASHPTARILCASYDLLDGLGVRNWTPADPEPQDLLAHVRAGLTLSAHNATFEWWIWNTVGISRHGWPPLPISQLRCSMAKARAWGLPGGLKDIGGILAPQETKDGSGARLLPLVSVPQTPSKASPWRFRTPATDPEIFRDLYRYCDQDVRSESAISALIPELSPAERDVWILDQEINVRGVSIDDQALAACIAIVEAETQARGQDFQTLTGGLNPGQVEAVRGWLRGKGVHIPDLSEPTVTQTLARTDLRPEVREVLEIWASLSQASVKKLFSIRNRMGRDGRLRDLFSYYGAERSGRWAGRGPQPQNLPAAGPQSYRCPCGSISGQGPACACGLDRSPVEWGPDPAEAGLQDIGTQDPALVRSLWGDPLALVSGCLRSLFVAGPGQDLLGADFSAIEAVVLAALAGESWRLEVFRTHGKIYETSASKITGIPFQEFLDHKTRTGENHPKRKLGKVAELASGYSGWINAWYNFGADKYMTEDEIKTAILAWRAASPSIVEFWGGEWRKKPGGRWDYEPHGLQGAAVLAIQNPGTCYAHNGITYGVEADVLYCRLPSGRCLCYHTPRLHPEIDRRGLTCHNIGYMSWMGGYLEGSHGWIPTRTYGGKLCENVVQAVARDILAHSMLAVTAAGYPIVLHVHDEIIAEVPQGTGDAETFRQTMARLPSWAEGWPLRVGEAWRGYRYRKG